MDGWAISFLRGAGSVDGGCTNCPRVRNTMHGGSARDRGQTYYFAPPRVFETQVANVLIVRMEDARPLQEEAV